QNGSLSEGHGRALLLAQDHGERARLAQAAVHGAWSVRTLEARARESNGAPLRERITGRASSRAMHPDDEQAARDIEELLADALGMDVRARPTRGGYRVELSLASARDAHELVRRLRLRAVA